MNITISEDSRASMVMGFGGLRRGGGALNNLVGDQKEMKHPLQDQSGSKRLSLSQKKLCFSF